MGRVRRTVVLVVCAALVGGLAVVAATDPFHLRHARWFTAGLVLLTLLLLTAAVAMLVRRGLLLVLALVIGGSAIVGWIGIVGLASRLESDNQVLSEVADGDRRLLVVEGRDLAIDPAYAVVLRAGGGPFEQESLVYQGWPEGPAPNGVRFVDTGTVEVEVGSNCRYRSSVEPGTLAIEPVHRPLQLNSC